MPELIFQDWVGLADLQLRSDAANFFEDVSKESGKRVSLLVDSPATYSGYLLNGRVYPGQHMQEGTRTWTDQAHGGISHFNKPVLLHHDSSQDPIGRVVKASFQALKSGDSFFEDYIEPARNGAEGSGVTTLGMRITDSAAIEKFLNKEYLTLSTSFYSPQAICTVCGTNMMQDGWCEHRPGQKYEVEDSDDVECYFVTGQMFYKEVSVVNDPAQPRAVVQNMKMEDCVSSGWDSQVWSPDVQPRFALQDSASGTITPLTLTEGERDVIPSGGNSIKRRIQVAIPAASPLTPEDVAQIEGNLSKAGAGSTDDTFTGWPVEDSVKETDLLDDEGFALAHIAKGLLASGLLKSDEELNVQDVSFVQGEMVAYIRGVTTPDPGDGHFHTLYLHLDLKDKVMRGWTEGTYVHEGDAPVQHGHGIEFGVKKIDADAWSGKTRDADRGDNHVHDVSVVLERDAQTVPGFDDVITLIDRYTDAIDSDDYWSELAADKQLSAKERGKLKSQTYCGPGRTFPIPDCAHVMAARRLIGRYKGTPAMKQAILDKVASKSAVFDYDGSETGQLSMENSEVENKTTDGAGGAPASTPDAASLKILTDQIATLAQEKKDLQSDRDRIQQELTDMTESANKFKAEGHSLRARNLALMRSVAGHADTADLDTFEKIERYGETLAERSSDSISDATKDEGTAFAEALQAKVHTPDKGVDPKVTDATTPDPRTVTRNQEDLDKKPEPTKDTDPADLM